MTDALIASIEGLIADLAIDSKLQQVGISHNHLPMLAEDAMKQTRLLVNNPRELSYDDAMRIYEAAL
jgi:alcohol dehydrogenase class IV